MRNKNKKVFFAAAVLSCMMMATPVFADQEITSADTQASMPASTFDTANEPLNSNVNTVYSSAESSSTKTDDGQSID